MERPGWISDTPGWESGSGTVVFELPGDAPEGYRRGLVAGRAADMRIQGHRQPGHPNRFMGTGRSYGRVGGYPLVDGR